MTKVERAVQWAISIANDDSHGYDQGNRWGPDYDCSSFIITAYENAGIPVKTSGAQRTYDMKPIFLKCGFEEVKNWNKSTGAGLTRGDIVLNVQHHVEMYIGDGKLVKASQNEVGGSVGGKVGDQTGKEIRISSYYNFPWDCALRYKGNNTYTGSTDSFTNAADYAISGTFNTVDIDYKDIKANFAIIDKSVSKVDVKKLKSAGVVGLMLDAGQFYDTLYEERSSYANPNLPKLIASALVENMPYGFIVDVRARTTAEANNELRLLRIYAQKYAPTLGIWLSLNFIKSKSINDSIISRYKEVLESAGYKGKMGFYVTRKQLETISWDKWKYDFYLMLIDHISDVSQLNTILTPEFFMLKR